MREGVGPQWAPTPAERQDQAKAWREAAMNAKKGLGITGLALAGLIVAGTGSEIRAQVAGSRIHASLAAASMLRFVRFWRGFGLAEGKETPIPEAGSRNWI